MSTLHNIDNWQPIGDDVRTGVPITVRGYHGTSRKYDEPSINELGSSTGAVSAREGRFYSSNPSVSRTYMYREWAEKIGGEIDTNKLKYQDELYNPKDKGILKHPRKELSAERKDFLLNAIASGERDRDNISRYLSQIGVNATPNQPLSNPTSFFNKVSRKYRVENLKPTMMVANIKLNNPLVVNGRDIPEGEFGNTVVKARKLGYDGVIIKKTGDTGLYSYAIGDDIVVFPPQ